jgi:hypothetical protein
VRNNPFAPILYAVANGKHYYRAIELLMDFPGTVLLHDINISGIPNSDAYGPRDEWGLGQLTNAKKILVHSRHAKELIRKSSISKSLKVEILPLGAPIRNIRKDVKQLKLEKITISSIGYAEYSKDSIRVFNTFLDLALRNQEWEFAFIGRVHKEWLSTWEARLKIHGLRSRFHFPGKVSDSELIDWIDKSTICVQLRAQSNGESSGALMDVLGRHKPAIVSRIGSFEEIDDRVVFKVPVGVPQKTLMLYIEELIILKQVHLNEEFNRDLSKFASARGFDHWFSDLLKKLV